MAQGRLTVDLDAVSKNYHILKNKLAPQTQIGAVLKANAYSLGAVQIAGRLIKEGCTFLFVATPEEGIELRKFYPDCTLMVLNGFYRSMAEAYITYNLIPVLGTFGEIKAYRKLSAENRKALPAALNFNIRMNRLGLGSVETEDLLNNLNMLEGLDVRCIMSHFSCADVKDHPTTQTQYEIFKEIAAHFPNAQKSLANSSGIFRNADFHFDVVRPGMALYGLNPTPENKNPMHPVVSLKVPVMRTRLVYKGAATGYGETYVFDKDTPIATVASGYADGLMWNLSNHGNLYWKNYPCPIRGRVSMDMATVDLSNVPEDQRPKPGDFMEVLGPSQREVDLAEAAGSFDYEILTSLGNRYERIYV